MRYKSEVIFLVLIFVIYAFPLVCFGSGVDILMFLWNGETKAEEGFREALTEEFLDQNINYKVLNIYKDVNRLSELIDVNDETEYDLIYTYGSKVTSKVAESYKTIPVVFNIVFDPIGYKIIESWDKKQSNLTGASNSIPIDLQLQKIEEIFGKGPIGFIYNPLNKNSVDLKEDMENYLAQTEEALIPFEFKKNFRSLRKYLESAKDQVKCIYFPSEWLISNHIKRMISEANRRKIPTCVTSLSYLKQGALLCISAEYHKVGKIAGRLAARILKGEKPGNLPVQRPSKSEIDVYASSRTVKRLKIYFPQEMEINYIK
jgi:putative ABC transport system substrate-binding protein